MLTFDHVLSFVLAISRVDDSLHNVKIALTLTLGFSSDHVLLELLGLELLAAVGKHVDRDRTLVVVVQLPPALVRGRSRVVLPRRVVVGFVLPFDLFVASQTCAWCIALSCGTRLPSTQSPSSLRERDRALIYRLGYV